MIQFVSCFFLPYLEVTQPFKRVTARAKGVLLGIPWMKLHGIHVVESYQWEWCGWTQVFSYLAILLVTFSGWLSDPFEWLSDLQLGDEVWSQRITWYIFFMTGLMIRAYEPLVSLEVGRIKLLFLRGVRKGGGVGWLAIIFMKLGMLWVSHSQIRWHKKGFFWLGWTSTESSLKIILQIRPGYFLWGKGCIGWGGDSYPLDSLTSHTMGTHNLHFYGHI